VPLLERDEDGCLEATTVLNELRRHHGERFGEPLLRTLQRRLHEWRAHHGPSKEVFFEQQHQAGREGAFDFTDCSELGVTIVGEPFPHLLFQFILSFSKWRFVALGRSRKHLKPCSQGFRVHCGTSVVFLRCGAATICRRPRTSCPVADVS